ncbi:CLUMA_CG016832, isoform A [Clunio marinus]|uniref:CLUMA_CG016832, isoform A n=1 Tax=Clunio marinus TaxID=568069 RepID=A0A1J1ITU2_9DIPT|nr:CLUMA_CG016832, isoform A [Clunio marinus]
MHSEQAIFMSIGEKKSHRKRFYVVKEFAAFMLLIHKSKISKRELCASSYGIKLLPDGQFVFAVVSIVSKYVGEEGGKEDKENLIQGTKMTKCYYVWMFHCKICYAATKTEVNHKKDLRGDKEMMSLSLKFVH